MTWFPRDELDGHLDEIEAREGAVDPFHRRMLQYLNEKTEGATTYPYLDHRGNVTIGFGNLLSRELAPNRVGELPGFVFSEEAERQGAVPPQLAQAQLRLLRTQQTGPESPDLNSRQVRRSSWSAPHYRNLTNIELAPSDMVSYGLGKVRSFHNEIQSTLPDFDSYPEPARDAIFDMYWNLGHRNFTRKSKGEFLRAVRAQDWFGASEHAVRGDAHDARNVDTVGKFLDAHGQATMYGPGGYPGYAPASSGVPMAGAVSRRRAPTLEELHAMSDEDFDANWDRVIAAARGPSIL